MKAFWAIPFSNKTNSNSVTDFFHNTDEEDTGSKVREVVRPAAGENVLSIMPAPKFSASASSSKAADNLLQKALQV